MIEALPSLLQPDLQLVRLPIDLLQGDLRGSRARLEAFLAGIAPASQYFCPKDFGPSSLKGECLEALRKRGEVLVQKSGPSGLSGRWLPLEHKGAYLSKVALAFPVPSRQRIDPFYLHLQGEHLVPEEVLVQAAHVISLAPRLDSLTPFYEVPSEQRFPLLRDGFLGCEEVHQQGYVHRDFKPENVGLYERRGFLFDFETLRPQGVDLPGYDGLTPDFLDLNYLPGSRLVVDPSQDVFAGGMSLLLAASPYSSMRLLFYQAQCQAFEPLSEQIGKAVDHYRIPSALADLIFEMTAEDAALRPSMAQAAQKMEAVL